jgi:bacterial/archaeal transporter family protein
MWVISGLFSALFLGIYDILRKISLKDNAVIPVLFLASATGGILFIPPVVLSLAGILHPGNFLYIPPATTEMHLFFFLKSVLVGTSWFLAYFAISRLPLTIVIPIRATGPTWTLLGALFIYQERFTVIQWAGILIVLTFFYIFSLAGRKEGFHFSGNKWILAIIAATLLGSASSLFDKFLVGRYDRMAMQAWFSIYMIPVFLPFLLFIWYPKRKSYTTFRWSPYIHLIGIVLTLSDFHYFFALSDKGSLIALLSVLRRSSVVISFAAGAFIFHDRNIKRKSIALAGILIGIVLIVLGTAN